MKAQTKVCTSRNSQEFPLKLDNLRALAKPGAPEAEMVACFAKLKELVPTIPADRKISRVALLQHVIDYILDLELTLDHHPAARTPPPQLLTATLHAERKPLSESTHLNTQSHLEAMELECSSRPASC